MTGDWLNGWARQGATVLVGTGLHCAGCGKHGGIVCVAFGDDPMPTRSPDWPFPEDDCPICQLEAELAKYPLDPLTARLLALQRSKEA